jgi:hypothetical protein
MIFFIARMKFYLQYFLADRIAANYCRFTIAKPLKQVALTKKIILQDIL